MTAGTPPILQRQVFDGPNIDLPCAAVRLLLDRVGLPAPELIDGLKVHRILLDHVRRRGDDRLGDDVDRLFGSGHPPALGEAVGALAVELQRLQDDDVRGWRLGEIDGDGAIVVTFACESRQVGLLAADAACDVLWMAAGVDLPAPGDLPAGLRRFLRAARAQARDDLMRPLLAEVARRGIPVLRLNEGGRLGRHTQLGHGCWQRQVSGTITDGTSAVAGMVAGSKRQTVRMLQRVGVPTPRQIMVGRIDAAVRAAAGLGYPVVVKPENGTAGQGVTAGVADEAELRAAFERAARLSREVVVEEFIKGEEHRLFVCGGKLVAATQRRRAQVTGDGVHTVRELVDEANRDPRRGPSGISVLVTLELDAAMVSLLARQGLTPDEMPQRGRTVLLRSTSNLKSGGTPVDVTERVHPDNLEMAELAAAAIGVDIAGIDFVTPDISRSHHDLRCAVVEVNISPSVNYYQSLDGDRWGVTRHVVDLLFPDGRDGRIPLVAVLAADPGRAEAMTRDVVGHLQRLGHVVGRTDGASVWLDEQVQRRGCVDALEAATTILAHPRVGAGVLSLGVEALLQRGLPWPYCDVAILDGSGAPSSARNSMTALAGCKTAGLISCGDAAWRRQVAAASAGCRHRHVGAQELSAGDVFAAAVMELLGRGPV